MDAELVARLRGVIPRLARQFNDTSTGEGLTPTQYSVLALVRGRGPLGLADLTEMEGINPTMLSRVVKALDERGLIRRMPDPNDMRAARLEATPAGAQVHDRVRAHRTKLLSRRLEQLPPGTAEALLAVVPAMEELADGTMHTRITHCLRLRTIRHVARGRISSHRQEPCQAEGRTPRVGVRRDESSGGRFQSCAPDGPRR